MIVWFVAIGAGGIAGIAENPEVLKALFPTYAVGFLFWNFSIAFFALAGVVLAVTGAEALYADLGHFGRTAITRAWLILVFPACILSYLGQGALVLADPSGTTSSPFFLLVPEWGRLPIRSRRLHGAHHLATRPRARHEPPRTGRRVAPGVRRRAA